MVFSGFFIYTYGMKKLLLILALSLCAMPSIVAAEVFADDYVFQKQIVINNKHTCQAFRIHQNWFATAAHCVEVCAEQGSCQVKILLAQGSVNASVTVGVRDVFIPEQYRTVDAKQRVSTHKNWDVALLHYQPEEYVYEFPEGGMATAEEFNQALKESRRLRLQWRGATRPEIPVLYTYGGHDLMTLKENLIVPRWNFGQMVSFSNPKTVLYFGEKQALWGADGFGVDHGNSGGAVVLPNGGIIGIATAIMDNQLPADVRQAFPTFGQAHDFFLFNGFAPKTTMAFIGKTLAHYGDRVRTKKLRKITPTLDPTMPPTTVQAK